MPSDLTTKLAKFLGVLQGTEIGVVHAATVTLTNAQTKTLPGTAVTIAAAAGANKIIMPVLLPGMVEATQVAGYTNVNVNAYFEIYVGGYVMFRTANADAEPLLAFGSDCVTPLRPQAATAGVTDTAAAYANEPMKFAVNNGGSGSLTGGDAGNSLRVSLLYTVFDISTGTFV